MFCCVRNGVCVIIPSFTYALVLNIVSNFLFKNWVFMHSWHTWTDAKCESGSLDEKHVFLNEQNNPFLKRKTQSYHKHWNCAFIYKEREKSICRMFKQWKEKKKRKRKKAIANGLFLEQSKSHGPQYFGLSQLCSCVSSGESNSKSYITICCHGA